MAKRFVYIDDSTPNDLKFKILDPTDLAASGSLLNWTESQSEVSHAVRAVSQLLAKENTSIDTDTDIDAQITPLNNGAFYLYSGNQRGNNAVDLSQNTDTNQVATGANAYQDGLNNCASGQLSKASGQDTLAGQYAEYARGTSKIYEYGDNQLRQIQWKLNFVAPNPMPVGTNYVSSILYLDNPTNNSQLTYSGYSAEGFDLTVTAHLREVASGNHVMKTWKFFFGLLNDNGNLGIMTSPVDGSIPINYSESGSFGGGLQTTWDNTNHYGWNVKPIISGSQLQLQFSIGSKACLISDIIYVHAIANISHVKVQAH